MTLQDLNGAEPAAAAAALLRCCGSKRWAMEMTARRPFGSLEALCSAADSAWWQLGPDDWLEAFAAHPRIGTRKLAGWSAEEQNGIAPATAPVLERLAEGNRNYENRFGWIFLINATGKSAAELLRALEARLKNDAAEELRVSAGEQAEITQLRLSKLLAGQPSRAWSTLTRNSAGHAKPRRSALPGCYSGNE